MDFGGSLFLLLLISETLEHGRIALLTVLQGAVDAADRRAGSAGLFENLVVDAALIEEGRDLIALLHSLEFCDRAEVFKKIDTLVDGLQSEDRLVHFFVAGLFSLFIHFRCTTYCFFMSSEQAPF